MRPFLPFSFLFLFLVGCDNNSTPTSTPADDVSETVEATESGGPPALIARDELFGNPVRTQGRISPDGQWLSWLAPHEGVINIFVAPADDPDAAKAITFDKGRGIPIHFWSYTNTHIFYTQDKDGDENDRVYSVDIATGESKNLTPVEDGVRARIEGVSKFRPDSLLIGINDRNPQLFDLYEITISTGEAKRVVENPGYISFLADNELTPRLAIRPQATGDLDVVQLDNSEVLYSIKAEDALNSGPLGFNKKNTAVYAISSEGRNTAALISVELASGAVTVLAEDQKADISDILVDPVTEEVIGYATNYKTTVWRGMSDEIEKELEVIDEAIPGEKQFLAATSDGNTLVIYAALAEKPGVYYLYDRAASQATSLFETRPTLSNAALEPMYPLEIPSRDGLTLVSYLTLPAGAARDEQGLPTEPHPMVLYVHGGPWARDSYGYNSIHQWLANRGHAVLSVNYRGSTGFGKSFINAAVKEFAGKMHDDLIDAVDWAVASGVTNKDEVAIMGGSYGGYATLVALTFTPDRFACGVDIVGPSSLVTLIESFPAYWGPSLQFTWYKFVGDPANETERADMFNRSPISRVADIQAPLLIGQGENDPRVTKLESDQMVAVMAEKELPVTYLNFPDEGHGFARPENRMAFFSTTEGFLSTCLGGRLEPIGNDFEGSSVQVLHGADYVPGLAEAVNALQAED